MSEFYVTLSGGIALMIVPENEGDTIQHPAFVRRYYIYYNCENRHLMRTSLNTTKDRIEDPFYLGTLVYKHPGRSLEYMTDGLYRLGAFQIKDTVDLIDQFRQTQLLGR